MANDGWETIKPKAKDDGWETISPNEESYAKRAVKALPGAFEGVGRTVGNIVGAVPQGLRMGGELLTGASLPEAIERSESSNPMQYVPSSQTGRDSEEMLGKAMQFPVEALGEGASVAAQVGSNMLGGSEDQRNKFDAAIRSATEGVANLALPVPGLKGTHAVARKLAGTDRKIRADLLRELDAQKNTYTVDPLTEGAKPNVAPWAPTKPGTQLPLDLGQQGVEGQAGLYEAGLPADAYLKRNVPERQFDPETGNDIYTTNQLPQPGQGDLFAGTRPYTPEELPAQAARGREAVARADALSKALEFKEPELTDPAGPEIGAPKPQLEMPVVESPDPGLTDLRSIEREIEDLKRQREVARDAMPYEQPYVESKYQAKQRIREQDQPPSYEAMPSVDALRLRALEDKRIQDRLVELEQLKRQIQQDSIPFDRGMRTEPNSAAPFKETPIFKPENGIDYSRPDGLNNQLPLNETQQRNVRPDEISTKLGNEPTQGRLDFPTADGSGIVQLGNGGHIDFKALLPILDAINKGIIKPIGDSLKGITVYRAARGGTQVQPGQWVTPDRTMADGVYKSPRSTVVTDRLPQKDLYEVHPGGWIYAPEGTNLANILRYKDENGKPISLGDIASQKEKSPYGDDLTYLGNGGFIHPEVIERAKNFIGQKATNSIEALKEKAKFNLMDKRHAKEVISNIDPNTVEDISAAKRGAYHLTDVDGLVRNNQDRSGSGPVIKWMRDQNKLIDRMKSIMKEDLLKGSNFVKSMRGFEFRQAADNSPLSILNKWNKVSPKEFAEFRQEWFEAMRDGRSPNFTSETAKKAFEAVHRPLEAVHKLMNGLRLASGLEAIPHKSNYFPLIRQGDYRVVIQDADGNMKAAQHFTNLPEAILFQKKFNLTNKIEGLEATPAKHLEKSKFDHKPSDIMAWEAIDSIFQNDPILLSAVSKALAEVRGKQGFAGKHSIEAQHIEGAMGFEPGVKGNTQFMKAFELYIERSIEYASNLQKRQKLTEINAAIREVPELSEKLKNTVDVINDLFEQSTGRHSENYMKWSDWTLDVVGRATGMGKSGIRQNLSKLMQVRSMMLLTTISNVVAQASGPIMGIPGLVKAEGGGLAGAALALKDVYQGYASTLAPSAFDREAVSWASKNGYISPEYVELLGARHIESKRNPIDLSLKAFSALGAGLEKEFVRIPYFLAQLHALKEMYPNKLDLFEMAGENTDRYMVDYNKSNQAMLWGKMGALGENSRSLKQFSHNALGQFLEFTKDAKKGDVIPLATYLATAMIIGGVTGNLLVQTTDDVIYGLNAMLGTNIPTIHEMVLKQGWGDMATFGGWSTVLGHDVSSSVAQNSVGSMFSLPLASMGKNQVAESFNYLKKTWDGTVTTADRMKAYLSFTPPAMKETVKQAFIENGIVPNPKDKMSMIYERTKEEQDNAWITQLIGRPQLNEARATNIDRAVKQDLMELRKKKMSSADALADAIIQGREVTPELLSKYISEGGDPSKISTLVKNRIMDQTFDAIDREYMKKGKSGAAVQEKLTDWETLKKKSNVQKQSYDGLMPPASQWQSEMVIPQKPMRNDGSRLPQIGEIQGSILDNMPQGKVINERKLPYSAGRYMYDPFIEARIKRIKAMQSVM